MANEQPVDSQQMQCMEIWGGNRKIERNFQTSGLNIFVQSQPYQNSETGGGDIYYLTSCASGRISRFLLADVSGHGEDAAELAVSLRDLMRNNVNRISQEKFVKQMNTEFGMVAGDRAFATAVIATYFHPTKRLTIHMAGHPNPAYYFRQEGLWKLVDSSTGDGSLENLPFGINDDVKYPSCKIETSAGDMLLLYSDAFVESVDESGKQIGLQGFVDLLNECESTEPYDLIEHVRERLTAMSPENLLTDDATAIVVHLTSPQVSWKNSLLAPFRLFRPVSDRTEIAESSQS